MFKIIEAINDIILYKLNRPSQYCRWINLEVMDACNSKCKHCNIWRKKPTKDILMPDEIKVIFQDNLFKRLEYVILTGGEPSLRNDLPDIVYAIFEARPNARILVNTNGLLPEKILKLVDTCLQNNMKLGVVVSVDGLGSIHDEIRGISGAFDKAIKLLKELKERKQSYCSLKFQANFTLSVLNSGIFKATMEYLRILGIPATYQIFEVSDYFNNAEYGGSLLGKSIEQALREFPESLYTSLCMNYVMSGGKPKRFPCFSMFNFCAIRCDGCVVPCMRKFWNYKCGNSRHQNFKNIWYSKRAKEARLHVKSCSGYLCLCEFTWSMESIAPIRLHLPEKLGAGLYKCLFQIL